MGGSNMFCEQTVFCIVFKPSYESSMTKDIRVLKRKKNCLEYCSKYTPRDVCNILLQSVQI